MSQNHIQTDAFLFIHFWLIRIAGGSIWLRKKEIIKPVPESEITEQDLSPKE